MMMVMMMMTIITMITITILMILLLASEHAGNIAMQYNAIHLCIVKHGAIKHKITLHASTTSNG